MDIHYPQQYGIIGLPIGKSMGKCKEHMGKKDGHIFKNLGNVLEIGGTIV